MNEQNETKVYTVSEAAALLGVTAKTLKNWEKKGEIPPAARNYKEDRVYTLQDIEHIRATKRLGTINRPQVGNSEPENPSPSPDNPG